MNMQLPERIQQQLQAADALEAAEQAARASPTSMVSSAADLFLQPAIQPPSPPQVTVAPTPPAAPPVDFEHKYRVLQGMYAADVTQLKSTLKAVVDEVQALRTAAPAQDAPKPAADPKDIENFGAEMMEMVQRYVTGVAHNLDARIGNLEAKVNGVTQQTAATAEQQFYALLTKLVPDWREINVDPKWLAWLGVVDKVYKLPRQAALDNAFKNADAEQVAEVFNTFKTSMPVATPTPTLNDQISPDSAGNPTPVAAVQKPILSQKSITDYYNDVSRGKYAGREAEAQSIEDIINIAVAEGRVR